jgi:hypothetical protein
MTSDSTAIIIKGEIKKFLEQNPGWHWGGILEDKMRVVTKSKGETTGRLCRFLVKDGILESRVISIEVDGKKKRAVQYRVKPTTAVKVDGQVVNVPSMF